MDRSEVPVESVGGYELEAADLGSNHGYGTAIDINPDANPQIVGNFNEFSSEINGSRA